MFICISIVHSRLDPLFLQGAPVALALIAASMHTDCWGCYSASQIEILNCLCHRVLLWPLPSSLPACALCCGCVHPHLNCLFFTGRSSGPFPHNAASLCTVYWVYSSTSQLFIHALILCFYRALLWPLLLLLPACALVWEYL